MADADIELVRDFVNTIEPDFGADAIDSPSGLENWLRAHGLLTEVASPLADGVSRARALREALRASLRANVGEPLAPDDTELLARQAARSGVLLTFTTDGAILEPSSSGVDRALGWILVAVAAAMADGSWRRLKACAADDCRWAFIDRSRNSSRHWCSMDVCGNRTKVRSFRQRRSSSLIA